MSCKKVSQAVFTLICILMVYILVYILTYTLSIKKTLFYCAITIYILSILFKSNEVWFEKYKLVIYFAA